MKTLDIQWAELKAHSEKLTQDGRRAGLLEAQLRSITARILRRDIRKNRRVA